MDEIASLEWDIVPKDEYEYEWVAEAIKKVKNFLLHPNKNNEGFSSHILKAVLKDILEIDAGVIVKVFDINSYNFDEVEPKSGAPVLKPMGQRTMTELYARDGASFLKEIDKFGFEIGFWQYSYQIPAHPMWFNRDEIVYCMEHPRSMSCYGYARTQAILDIIKSLHYSTLYNKRFFEESPIPDGALSVLDTNEVEMKDFMNYWNTEFKAQPHKVAVINKDLKWQPFVASNRELEFLETQKWYFNVIISAFGLTPSELGITDDLNRATSATQAELVKRKGIRPFLKMLECYINNGIIPEFGFEGIEFQFIYDDPAEKKAKLDNWNLELNMGVKTINDVRNELGMEPIKGGDVSNSLASRMTLAQGTQDNGMKGEESAQSSGYKDNLKREEANNQPKTNKAAPDPEQLKMGIKVEREHQDSLKLTDEEVKQIALDHLKEDPKYYTKLQEMESKKKASLSLKGADDGQYYHDQPISQPRRPSGAEFQPQNPQPRNTDTALPSPWQAHLTDNPSHSNVTNCPLCNQATLATLNSEEILEEDIRCTNCGARFKSSELLAAPMMAEIANTLQQYNVSTAVTIPEQRWIPKSASFTKQLDMDMDVKSYCGFDTTKSFPFSLDYAESKGYRDLLMKYLDDLKVKDVDSIIKVLLDSMKGEYHDSIFDVAQKINKVINDEPRANLIARTEIIRLANEGNLARMAEKGQEKVIYISAPEDGRLCPKCKALDGKIFNLKDARGIIPSHCRCRCTFSEYEEA